MDLEKVLLTGSTGFLGVHLLRELAFNDSVNKIYCLVRETINESNQERFEKRIAQYFDEKTCAQIKKKSIVISGDLRNKNLGLDRHTFTKVFLNVKTIINAAANVKHIGKYSTSYTDNVQTVNNLIDICLKFNISLAHMSTLSINGLPNQNVRHIFTENTLNINQTFNKNPYLISKFEAEQSILKNISENFLNAKIFRIGNIMPRLSDNVFQINYDQNGFLLSINELSKLQMITKNIEDLDIALSPVDEVSKCIMTILQSSYCNTIYHVETDKTVKVSRFIDLFNQRNIKFQVITQDKFDKKLKSNYSIGSAYVNSFFRNEYNKYSNQATSIILDELNFKWEPLPDEYLDEIINLGLKIK